MHPRSMTASMLCLFALLSASCSKSEAPAPLATPPVETAVTNGVLTYAVGDVAVQNGTRWLSVDIGDSVAQDAIVRTGKQSVCDIQFGQFGVIHLSESTTLALKTVTITSRRKVMDVELVVGTVTAKVSKLVGADRFQVRTDTVTCGVRGTRFVVTRKDASQTTVAVAEGLVGLVPPAYDPQRLETMEVSSTTGVLIQQAEARILAESPSVGVGAEVVVSRASMARLSEAMNQIQAALAAPEIETQAGSDSADAAFEAYRQARSTAALTPRQQGPESKTTLEETAGLKLLETFPENTGSAQASPTPTPTPTPKARPVSLGRPGTVFPVAGQTIDIVKTASIVFSWNPVIGATDYEVRLYLVKDASRSLVKTWTTSKLSVVLDKFDELQAGAFAWEVAANEGSEQGPAATTPFQIVKGSALPAPSLDLSGSSPSTH